MDEPTALFENTICWLRLNYACFTFFTERDIVWTIQKHIIATIEVQGSPYRIRHNYRVTRLPRAEADLVILDAAGGMVVAAEFKYEPSHRRAEFPASKLPVAFWSDPTGSVCKDVERTQQFVNAGKVRAAYSVFIDEGRHFREQPAPERTAWVDWEGTTTSLLWGKVEAPNDQPAIPVWRDSAK